MKEYTILKIDEYYSFVLYDGEKTHHLNIEFYSKIKPEINDTIILNESILDRENTNYCAMINLEYVAEFSEKYEQFMKNTSNEFAILVKDDKKYIFKRIYG